MKKVYALTLLLLLTAVSGFSQVTGRFYAGGGTASVPGPTGTYRTGTAKYLLPPPPAGTYSRLDNIIAISNNSVQKQSGYATFDFYGIPWDATIASVKLGVAIIGVTSATTAAPALSIYGRIDDYAVTSGAQYVPGANFSNLTAGTALAPPNPTLITNTAMLSSTIPADYILTQVGTASPLCSLVKACIGTPPPATPKRLSISFTIPVSTAGNLWQYNLGGETLDSNFAAVQHAPYLEVVYCYKPTSLTGSVVPTPVCAGQTFTLSSIADGANGYRWRGPNGFNRTGGTVIASANALSQGLYSVTAYAACGTFSDSTMFSSVLTTSLTVNPSPASLITTTTTVCVGNTIYMSDITSAGTWITSNPGQATVSTTGAVTALASGFPIISYRLGTCLASATVTVNDPPDPITGPTEVCASGGQITLLNNITAGGVWSSTVSSLATIDPSTGVVTGVTAGSLNISYMTGGCPSVGYPITVNPLPNPITGGTVVCVNSTIPLSSTTSGGTWSSSSTVLANVDVNTGVVTGTGAGSPVFITYTLPTGCYVTHSLTVNPQPNVVVGPAALCAGQCANLSDATTGGTWTSSLPGAATVNLNTGYVCAQSVGIQTAVNITYTSPANGCYILHPMNINPLPKPIAAPTQVCAESAFLLTNPDLGGTWSSSSTVLATVDASTGTAQAGTTTGTVRFTYTFIATGCAIDATVTVLPLPTSTITPDGPMTFCAGDDVTLTGPTGLGYTYLWYSNGVSLPSETNITYTTSVTELVNLQVTDGNGCSKMSADAQITLIPAVAIAAGGPVVLCQPNGVTLSVPLAPGILYQWKLNGANIPGANAHTYNAVVNGIYTADLVVPGGCFSTTPPFTVTVHDMPHPPISFNGTTINTITGYFDYQWFLNTIAIPGATSTSVTPTTNGQYIVRVIDGNGCVGYSPVYILNLGVDQVGSTGISIYPNPATAIVNISAPIELKAVVTGIDGRTLIEQENAKQVDISKLPNGLYMIMLYNKNGDRLFVQKLTKE